MIFLERWARALLMRSGDPAPVIAEGLALAARAPRDAPALSVEGKLRLTEANHAALYLLLLAILPYLGKRFGLWPSDPIAEAKAKGENLPSNHSPLFAPDLDPALRTGITAEVAVLRNLFSASADDLHKLTQNNDASGSRGDR